jgi:hypothetical protein
MRPYSELILLLCLGLVGCTDRATTYPVSGTIKLANGEPLPGGLVIFHPMGGARQPARSAISRDGQFQLGTSGQKDGAVPGHHKVLVFPAVPDEVLDDPAAVARYRSAVASRYQSIDTTPLEFTVKDDGSPNQFDIVLESSRAARR